MWYSLSTFKTWKVNIYRRCDEISCVKEYYSKSYTHFDDYLIMFKGINKLTYIQLSNISSG